MGVVAGTLVGIMGWDCFRGAEMVVYRYDGMVVVGRGRVRLGNGLLVGRGSVRLGNGLWVVGWWLTGRIWARVEVARRICAYCWWSVEGVVTGGVDDGGGRWRSSNKGDEERVLW